jgi:hypothetical protein
MYDDSVKTSKTNNNISDKVTPVDGDELDVYEAVYNLAKSRGTKANLSKDQIKKLVDAGRVSAEASGTGSTRETFIDLVIDATLKQMVELTAGNYVKEDWDNYSEATKNRLGLLTFEYQLGLDPIELKEYLMTRMTK